MKPITFTYSILVLLAVISFWDALEQLKKQEVPLSEEAMAYCMAYCITWKTETTATWYVNIATIYKVDSELKN